jgi:hypothetical protein
LLESSIDNKDEVAVVSFRGARAEIVLQPCRDAAAADERKLLKCENNPENASIHRTKGWSYYCRLVKVLVFVERLFTQYLQYRAFRAIWPREAEDWKASVWATD